MKEFKGIVPGRTKKMRLVFAALSLLMLFQTIMTHRYIFVPMVILVFLACFFSKEHVIEDKGIDLRYHLFNNLFTFHNWWEWDEVTTLHTDYRKAAPNVQLHIGKDIVVRTFIMSQEDIPGIIDLARKKNPDIYIED
ncbi:MAG: hypothetical protein Q4B78_03985 [Bacillota bacterium]|nr:hypothetical protein [Bacillota bacterium]